MLANLGLAASHELGSLAQHELGGVQHHPSHGLLRARDVAEIRSTRKGSKFRP